MGLPEGLALVDHLVYATADLDPDWGGGTSARVSREASAGSIRSGVPAMRLWASGQVSYLEIIAPDRTIRPLRRTSVWTWRP